MDSLYRAPILGSARLSLRETRNNQQRQHDDDTHDDATQAEHETIIWRWYE